MFGAIRYCIVQFPLTEWRIQLPQDLGRKCISTRNRNCTWIQQNVNKATIALWRRDKTTRYVQSMCASKEAATVAIGYQQHLAQCFEICFEEYGQIFS